MNLRDGTGLAGESTELLLANVELARDLGRGAIRSGEDPLDVLDRMLDHVAGFISGRVGMVVPLHMIDPDELAQAIERGKELAAKHGW